MRSSSTRIEPAVFDVHLRSVSTRKLPGGVRPAQEQLWTKTALATAIRSAWLQLSEGFWIDNMLFAAGQTHVRTAALTLSDSLLVFAAPGWVYTKQTLPLPLYAVHGSHPPLPAPVS